MIVVLGFSPICVASCDEKCSLSSLDSTNSSSINITNIFE